MIETKLDSIHDAISDDALLERAINDYVAALLRRSIVGLTVSESVVTIDRLRQQLDEEIERAPHDRPRQIIRIRIRRT